MKLKSLLTVLVLAASFTAQAFDFNDIRGEWDRYRITQGFNSLDPSWNGITFGLYKPGHDLVVPGNNIETLNVYAKTATATLSRKEVYGGVITNTGASGAIVLSLPAPVVGMHFRVYLTVAQDVDINPADSTQILAVTNATGDAISSAATIGNAIELVALSSTTWGAFAVSGTFTDVN